MNELFDLFSSVETNTNSKPKDNFYSGIIEARVRPNNEPFAEKTSIAQMTNDALELEIEKGEEMSMPTTPENHNVESEPKAYSTDEILEAATEYFKGDSLAASVWMNKYALKDSYGKVYELTPADMHRRLAKEFARMEAKYPNPLSEEKIYSLLEGFKYIIPQGSPMAGIGNDFQIASLSNCFVIGNNGSSDSYGGIMKVDEEQVQLMKRRGGVGHDLSHIRPTGSPVKNSALTSTGIVPFMERYSNSTREVAQDGRRGALMLSISVKHPDAERFIDAKMTHGKVTGANVSVRIDDEFMRSVINNTPYTQKYPIDAEVPTYTKQIDAKKLWDKLIHNAWSSAEPGILFWDTIIRESVPDSYADLGFRTVSTNPCGEIPLCPYDSCRLIALNLYSYVENPFTPEASFNYPLFKEHVQYGQRLMDDLIDLEMEKIDKILEKIDSDPETEDVKHVERELWHKIKTKTLQGRRTGLGITAEGDMLAALNLQYGCEKAIDCSVEVQKHLAIAAYTSSVTMARERGAFPVYSSEKERNNPFIGRLREAAPELYSEMIKFGRRNIALLTIAPTGSVSICTQTTSGIEPVFMVSYKRRRKVNPNDKNVVVNFVDDLGDSWEEFNVFHPKFLKWLKMNNYNVDEVKLMSDADLNGIIAKSPYYKATSNDIDWVSKVSLQGAVQKWVDHSISVTVNLPANVNEEMVSNIYKKAWQSGCKGMTIYRDGSRSGVLISNDKKEDKAKVVETQAPVRPKRVEAEVVRFQNNNEKWIAFVGIIENRPYEIFTGKAEDIFIPTYINKGFVVKFKEQDKETRYDFHYNDKDGYPQVYSGLNRTFSKEFWNYAKLISGILRHGMPISDVVDIIQKMNLDSDNINTWKNGVVRALKRFIPDGTKAKAGTCPECGSEKGLIYKEGCLTCTDCGYSKCG